MLELALIGAGTMGANHGRVAMALRDARLSVVVDPDEARGRALADRIGARYSPDHRRISGMVDAAIVAVPTALHRHLTIELLESGIHVLVEKPIAASPTEGREMMSAAERSGKILMIGHVERFNPAVLELDDLVTQPLHITAERISPYTARIDEGVTPDLMIHDLDLVSSLCKSQVARVQALTKDVVGTDDLTVALIEFESGASASVTASRLGQQKIRQLTITQPDNVIRADLVRQMVEIHRVGRIDTTQSGAGIRQSGIVEVPFLRQRGEPLLLELEHFVYCVTENRPPRVDGAAGVAALELVEAVRQAAKATKPLVEVG